MQKVYLSSTFRDLEEHRAEVISFFNRFKQDFSLLAMEDYVAQDILPLDLCEQHARECDIYILVIANRYGYIPAEERNAKDEFSITQLEFQAALKTQKKILVFIADENCKEFPPDSDQDEKLREKKVAKLKEFKNQVRSKRLTHPEGFISPFQLALQVAESLMKTGALKWQVDSYRRFCINRGAQMGSYLTAFSHSQFKVFVVSGNEVDLPQNLVHRLALFSLNIKEADIIPPLTFQDFFVSDTYEKNRELMLNHLFNNVLKEGGIPSKTTELFIQMINEGNRQPPVVKIDICDDCLDDNKIGFLQKFFSELNTCCVNGKIGKKLYFFLNIMDEKEDAGGRPCHNEKIKKMIPGHETYMYELPRLPKTKSQDLKQWLSTYITIDQGVVLDIFKFHFKDSPGEMSMWEAEKKIRGLINLINNDDPALGSILNNNV